MDLFKSTFFKGGMVGTIVVVAVSVILAQKKKDTYKNVVKEYPIDSDKYTNEEPSWTDMMQTVLLHEYLNKTSSDNGKPFQIVVEDSSHIPDLKVTRRATQDELDDAPVDTNREKPPLIVGTIRMGYGHHRIAHAAVSWGVTHDNDVYFHDLLGVESDQASLLDFVETLYSTGSRLATSLPDPLESILSGTTASAGNANMLRLQSQTAASMTSLMSGLDKTSPVVSTHPLVGCIAVAAGFRNVVNLVVDNHAQWFSVVPGALNLVQGPALYQGLLRLGVPEEDLELAGHWCPKEMVDAIPDTTQRRIRRVESRKPLRLLIPVGGAGAQESLLTDIIEGCAPLVQAGKLQLLLNAGDHAHIKDAFQKTLNQASLEFDTVSSMNGLNEFYQHLLESESHEPRKRVTLFTYNDTFPAVATTDKLANVADVLVCKPSEMAFYAVPKLMIRRVGDHEAKSALRTAELGDGTMEARTMEEIMQYINLFLEKQSLLTNMNKAIEKNNQIGVYSGVKIAVERAMER